MSDDPMIQIAGPLTLLRQAREASGLHIAALAAALKVPVKKLEALEAGRYEELPDMTFARALASSACRQLKVDPVPVLQQIPAAPGPQLGEGSTSINAPFKGVHDRQPFHPAGWLSRSAVLAAIAVLLAALVLLLMPGGDGSPPEALMPPGSALPDSGGNAASVAVEPAPPAVEPVQPVVPATNETTSPVAQSAAGASGVVGATPTDAPVESSPPTTTSTVAAAVPSQTAVLSIAVSGDSWVEVVNGQGSTVVQRMLKAGDVLDFSTAPPYSVVIGRADVAQVSVRGKVLDIAPYARNSVARFEVR